ncbi:MAG: hypothetical protein Q8R59_07590, partial [Polaromonas sp.]|nr:hypothetical protein [Polaromonas sp.]
MFFSFRIPVAIGAASVLLGLAACTTAPTHPALAAAQAKAELPPLVPVRRFVANIDFAAGFVLSPDGQRLMWRQTVGTDGGLAVRQIAEGSPVTTYAVGNQGRGGIHTWLADSRHVLYSKDPTGDENTQLLVQDTRSAALAPWEVTPWRGVRSVYHGRSGFSGAKFFFSSNRRDKSTLDLYEGDAQTRTFREVARSDGTVTSWIMGVNRELAGRARQLGRADGSDVAIELLQTDGSWRLLKTVGGFDGYWMNRVDTAAGKA